MFEYLINTPTKVIFGMGKSTELGKIAAEYGKKAFVIMAPFMKRMPAGQNMLDELHRNGVSSVETYEVQPNPRNHVIDQLAERCIAEKCDLVVGIGGGSAIDTAKGVAVVATNGGNCWDYTSRSDAETKIIQHKPLPLIAVPTTAGTGTEVTPYAVINNEELKQKATIGNDLVFPEVALVDPGLMLSKSRQLTALTAIDAFSHALESYINIYATPYSEMIALQAIDLFAKNIQLCCDDPGNIHARENMALSSTLAGIAIAHSPTTVPHAVGQPLSGKADAPHGASIACCIVQVIEWTLPYGAEKIAKVAELFDPSICGLGVEEKANRLPALLKSLFTNILDMPVTMGLYGLTKEDVTAFVDAIISCYGNDLYNHPKVPQRNDLIEIVNKCI